MKATYLFSVLAASVFQSSFAAPTAEPIADAAPAAIEEKSLSKRTFFWYPGLYKGWKLKIHAPGYPCHGKYLGKKDDGYGGYNLGYGNNGDFQYYFDKGDWYENTYGVYPKDDPQGYGQVYLDGPPGYYNLKPSYGYDPPSPPPSHPSPWGCDKGKWAVWPAFPIGILKDIFFWKQYWLKYQWQEGYNWGNYGGNNGWDYIAYDDGNGGYDVKYWDHKYEIDPKIKIWFIVKLEIIKYW